MKQIEALVPRRYGRLCLYRVSTIWINSTTCAISRGINAANIASSQSISNFTGLTAEGTALAYGSITVTARRDGYDLLALDMRPVGVNFQARGQLPPLPSALLGVNQNAYGTPSSQFSSLQSSGTISFLNGATLEAGYHQTLRDPTTPI